MFLLLLFSVLGFTSAARTCYGDINNLSPTGRKVGGVTKSNSEVQTDLTYLNRYRSCYQTAADKLCIQASVIAAVASRESRGGSLLEKTNGYGDGGKAYGIMQCDIKNSGLPCTSVSWNSCAHIEMMTGALIAKINEVKRKFPNWPAERQLQGGVAAYNFGSKNVQSWSGLDVGTTNNDYSNDIIARAKYLYSIGWN
ncbi:glycine glutamate and proline-rich protein [Biomphalaria glabrata]